jgi:hypothetical protein
MKTLDTISSTDLVTVTGGLLGMAFISRKPQPPPFLGGVRGADGTVLPNRMNRR